MDGSLNHSLREDRWLDVVSQAHEHTSKELLVSLSRMLENEGERSRSIKETNQSACVGVVDD